MLYLDKILAQLAYPLGFSLSLALLALLLLGLRRRRWSATLLTLSLLWLIPWSLPVVSDALRRSLEGQFAHQPVADLPQADAIVVLGGGVTPAPHLPRALATFRAAGIDAQALADSTRALKEYLGLWVYRWRGWAE